MKKILLSLSGIFILLLLMFFAVPSPDTAFSDSNTLDTKNHSSTPTPTPTCVPTAPDCGLTTSDSGLTSSDSDLTEGTSDDTDNTAGQVSESSFYTDRSAVMNYFDFGGNPRNLSLKYETSDISNLFYLYGDKFWEFFRFCDSGIVGVGKQTLDTVNYDNIIINTNNAAYCEMYFGFTATIRDGRYLTVSQYFNEPGYKCTRITLTFMDKTNPVYSVSSDKTLTADLYDTSYINGCYAITAEYESDDGGSRYSANLYMIINYCSDSVSDCEAYICYGHAEYNYSDYKGPTTRQTEIAGMIEAKGITPDNSLDYNIAYPYEAAGQSPDDYVYDTYYWISKSDEILAGHKNDSAAYKTLLLHDWMTENLIYDSYKANYLENPRYYGHYDTGEYYVSQCYVGVCRDYVNIYSIMCRRAGIPCIILGNTGEGHVWNAVYLYGEWIEVDITGDIDRYAENADVTDVTPAAGFHTHCYRDFCNYRFRELMPVASEVNKWMHFI